jgi:hypothetical protein
MLVLLKGLRSRELVLMSVLRRRIKIRVIVKVGGNQR